jgi:S1-C subfamily serine protease
MTALTRVTRLRRLSIAIVLSAGLLTAGLIAFSGDSTPSGVAAVAPVRVTAGSQIATGFAVGRDRVVTVAHVVDGAVKVDGVAARPLRVDRRSDLALLAVPGIVGRSSDVAAVGAGDEVRIVRLRGGRPSPLSVRVGRAIVAHVRAAGAERAVSRPALELAAAVRAGDSGAPVVSGSGDLAGVVFAGSNGREDTAYAVDASALTRLLTHD